MLNKSKNAGNQSAKKPLERVASMHWTIRCTPLEFAEWSEKAIAAGVNRSELTRNKLNEG